MPKKLILWAYLRAKGIHNGLELRHLCNHLKKSNNIQYNSSEYVLQLNGKDDHIHLLSGCDQVLDSQCRKCETNRRSNLREVRGV